MGVVLLPQKLDVYKLRIKHKWTNYTNWAGIYVPENHR